MKSLIVSTAAITIAAIAPATAADIVAQPAPIVAPAVPAFTWSGAYIGIRGGGSWVDGDFSLPGTNVSTSFDGGLVGGFVGYNWQFDNNVVLGVEGDLNYTWNKKTFHVFGTSLDAGTDVSGSLRARLGYAWDRALLYATGGWEMTRGFVDGAGLDEKKTFNGWTVGAGIDYAFTDHLFGRLEYRYADFGDKDIQFINADLSQNVVTVGLGYKF